MRVSIIGISGSIGFVAFAQTDCSDILRTDGSYAYEQCTRKNRDGELSDQIRQYKNTISAEKDRTAAYYKNLRDQIEYNAKQHNIDRERELNQYEYQLSWYDKKSDEYKRTKQKISDIKDEQKAVKRYKDTYKKILSSREDMEKNRLDLQLAEYELQVRGYPLLYARGY